MNISELNSSQDGGMIILSKQSCERSGGHGISFSIIQISTGQPGEGKSATNSNLSRFDIRDRSYEG